MDRTNLRFGEYGINWTSPQVHGLAGWWPECRFDLVGGKHGTPVGGVLWRPANYGQLAAVFDGTNDHIDLGNNFNNNGTLPVSIVIRVRKPNTSERYMVSKQLNSGNFPGWSFSMADKIFFQLRVANGNRILVSTAASSVEANKDYTFVVTYDGSKTAAGCNLYINGRLMAKTTNEDTLTGDSSTSEIASIGSRAGVTQFWDGPIYSLAIYNRVLPGWVVDHISNPSTHYDLYLPLSSKAEFSQVVEYPSFPVHLLAGD